MADQNLPEQLKTSCPKCSQKKKPPEWNKDLLPMNWNDADLKEWSLDLPEWNDNLPDWGGDLPEFQDSLIEQDWSKTITDIS